MLNDKDRTLLENQIIAGLFLSENFFLKVYDSSPNTDDLFLNIANREIYQTAIEHFIEKGYPTAPDVFTQLILNNVCEEIKEHFISGPTRSEPTNDFNIILKLIEDSIERKSRKVIEATDKKRITGLEYATTIREKIDEVLLDKFECYRKDNRTNQQKVFELLNSIQRTREGNGSDYIPTGFTKLDSAIIGVPRAHLTTIASRPGMGKTSFMLQLKRNLVKQGFKPLIISIEMPSDQLLIKDLSAYSGIDSRRIESGTINDEENLKITDAAKLIYDDNYFIEDDGAWTIEKVKATIRRYLIKQKIDIVFIDYLTLIRTPNRKDRYDLAIGEMTNSLREFAKETKLPVVVLSQLNRECERRFDKKPQLSDLRESGNIEQDSKTVLFLYRPGYYGIIAERLADYSCEGRSILNEEYAEVIVSKCRNGKTGIVPLRYRQEIHLFENLSRKDERYPEHVQHSTQNTNWYERETDEDSI